MNVRVTGVPKRTRRMSINDDPRQSRPARGHDQAEEPFAISTPSLKLYTDTPHTLFFSCTVRMHNDVHHTTWLKCLHERVMSSSWSSMMSG